MLYEVITELVRRVEELASEKGCTPAQLALAWVLAQGEDMLPIPGISRQSHLEDDLGALSVSLTKEDLAHIDEIA